MEIKSFMSTGKDPLNMAIVRGPQLISPAVVPEKANLERFPLSDMVLRD